MATINWNGGAGNWTTFIDWSTGAVPGPSDDAVIAAAGGYTVAITSPITVGSIAINDGGATLAINDPGNTVSVNAAVTNGGLLFVDAFGGQGDGGSSLTIGGTLTNSNIVQIGVSDLTAATTVTAQALVNTGNIGITGSATKQATLHILAAAPATWTGAAFLSGDALLEFGGTASITGIASNAFLDIDGPQAFVAAAGVGTGSNSALTGLASNAGTLRLRRGASVTTTGDLTNSGSLQVDNLGGQGDGGSSLTIGGTLTNSNSVQIGVTDMTSATTVTAQALVNTGTIGIAGSATKQATLDILAAAPATWTGAAALTGDALLEFGGTASITDIGSNAFLDIDGAQAFVAAAGAGTGSNSALTGLAGNAGTFRLRRGAALTTTGDLTNTGSLQVDNLGGQGDGGSSLTIGGTLTNSNLVQIGVSDMTSSTTVTAQGLVNTGSIGIAGSATKQATLDIAAAAPTTWTGAAALSGDALLEFGGTDSVTDIASNAFLDIDGPQAFVAAADVGTGSNSALTGLAGNAGTFRLRRGAALTTTGDLTNTGSLQVDNLGGQGDGGSSLTIDGTLTNSNSVQIGVADMTSATTVIAQGLVNTGSIAIAGSVTKRATLDILALAPTTWTGAGSLTGDALLEFRGAASITGIGSNAFLDIDGTQAFVAAAGIGLGSNSALTGLANNAGTFRLRRGASLTTTGDLTNSGSLQVDSLGGQGDGGSSLTIGGTLINSNSVQIGVGDLTSPTTVTAQALVNTGTIGIAGSATNKATLDILAAAPATWTAAGFLSGDALLEFGGTASITGIGSNGFLDIDGPQAFVAAAGVGAGSNSALTGLASNAGTFRLRRGAALTTTGDLTNTGNLQVDSLGGQGDGGSSLTIGGTLTNSNSVQVGVGDLTSPTTVTAQALVNTGTIGIAGSATNKATLDILAAAPATWTGAGFLSGDALLEFGGTASITGIGSNALLDIDGPQAFVAAAGVGLGSNSALTGLASNAGTFRLRRGAALTTTGDLTNSGNLQVDNLGGQGDGGSSLTIGGTLTNSNSVQVGVTDLTSPTTVTAQALVNTGTIGIAGSATNKATLDILAAAPATWTGAAFLTGDALLEFGGTASITGIGSNAFLDIDGPQAFVAAAGVGTGSNSALTGLAGNAGTFRLRRGAALTTTGDLTNTGSLQVDNLGGQGDGGSSLTIGGTLTNSNLVQIGVSDMTSPTTVTAQALVNTGTINLSGTNASLSATLSVAGAAANAGVANIGNAAFLKVTGGQDYTQSAGATNVLGTLGANVDVTGGTLDGTGTITGNVDETGGTVFAGSDASHPGTLTVNGSYSLSGSGTLAEVLTGTSSGQAGQIRVTGGAVNLQGGTLQIEPSGFGFAAGQTFTILTFTPGSLTGTFSTIADGPFTGSVNRVNVAGGLSLNVVYDNAAGDIRLDVVNSPTADHWVGGTGLWSDSNTWSAGVPTANSDVVIGDTASGHVTLQQAAIISSLTINSGNTLEVAGGESLDITGGTAVSGQLLVDDNAQVEFGGGETGSVAFNGTSTLRLDAPANFLGTIANIAQGDTLILTNTNATSAVLNGSTLTVNLGGGGTLSYTLAGNVAGDGFDVSKVGADSDIRVFRPPTLNTPSSQTVFTQIATLLAPLSIGDANATGPLTVTINVNNGVLSAHAAGAAAVAGSGSNSLTLTGSLADINTSLASVTYKTNSVGDDTVTLRVSDQFNATASASIAITAGPIPFTPGVVHGPANADILAGSKTAIGGISVNDPFAEANGLPVVLDFTTSAPVAMTANGSGGIVVGQGTNHLQIKGTPSQVNSYLSDDFSEFLDAGLELAALNEQADSAIKLLNLVNTLADPANAGKTVFDLIPNVPGTLTPPAAFFEVGVSAVTYGIASLLSLLPGGTPPDFQEFQTHLLKILAGKELCWLVPGKGAHIAFQNGQSFNFDAAGEFVLGLSNQPGDSFQVQARFAPFNGSASTSVMTELGVQVGSDRVTFAIDRSNTVWIDGNPVTLDPGNAINVAAGQVGRVSADTYRVDWNTGESIIVTDAGTYLGAQLGLGPNNGPGTIEGLAGSNNAQGNQFQLPNGTLLTGQLSTDELYQVFANSWRVQQNFSLLDYGPGQTTATFTDTSFPKDIVTLADLPTALLSRAAAAVAAAGITDPAVAAAAEYDFLASGGEARVVTDDASALSASTTTQANIIRSGPAPSVLGVIADSSQPIQEAGSGATPVTFDVYLTSASAQATTVDYHVVAAGAGFFDAAAFGGTLPSGTITLAAGQTTGTFTILLPQNALTGPSEDLAVDITSPGGTPIFAPTSQATVFQLPKAGPPADPEFSYLTNLGVFTQNGNNYTLDLGDIGAGEALPLLQFGLGNTASAPADTLGGTFTVGTVSGVTVSGASLPGPLNAGQTYTGLDVAVNTGAFETSDSLKFGLNSETITFSPNDSNSSGYSAALPDRTLTITYDLTPPTMAFSYAWGDVHIITYNGLHYDFQAAGEFTLAKSRVPGDSFDIQLRLQPWSAGASVTVITEVAASVGTDRVTFDISRPDVVWVDGVASTLSLANPTINLAAGQVTELTSNSYKVTWNTGEEMTVFNYGNHMDVADGVPLGLPGFIQGLQGEDEGQSNDFQLPDGTVLQQPLTQSELYGQYADAWRVTQATSLFDYGPGQTTGTFTNKSFPGVPLSLASVPAAILSQAAQAVAAAGITDPITAAEAEYDYIFTGSPTFITGAQTIAQQGSDPNATAATVTGGPAPVGVGVAATQTSFHEAVGGPTQVTFEAFLTSAAAADTTVDYTVVAPDSTFLGATAFGGALPSGQVTISQGGTTAQITIDVPAGALGALSSENLEVQVSAPGGQPVVAPIAQTEIINNNVEPGAAAVPELQYLGNVGTFTHVGNAYTLDLGSVAQAAVLHSLQFAVVNAATAPADDLTGTFGSPTGNGYSVAGTAIPTPIHAGQSYQGLYVIPTPNSLGAHDITLTFTPNDVNASGYSQTLSPISLTVKDTVAKPAQAALDTPATIIFPNVRVGTLETQHVSVTNTATAPAQSLDVTPVAGSDVTASGSVSLLAPGATDASDLTVGLDTSTAGALGGYVTLVGTSDGGDGNTSPILPNPTIDIFGSVYREAAASVSGANAIVHVNDPGTLSLTVSNTAPADGFSESLIASLAETTGNIGISSGGPTGDIAAGASDNSSLAVSFSTAQAGTVTGTASVALTSDGGLGPNSIDGLGTIALTPQSVPVNITVDNFAVAALAEASGGGTFTRNGNNYTLDFGTLAQGSGPVSINLNALNTATGPADALAGSFQVSGPSVFAATGFGGFSGLDAGASIGIGTITLDTGTAGTFQETLTFDPTGSNASGYMAALAPETLTVTAVVASTGPQLTGQIVLASATEGLALGTGTLVANFSDSDVSDAPGIFNATIDWGDGTTSPGTVSGASGSFTVSGDHVYGEEGAKAPSVTITDTLNSATLSLSGNVTVADAALTAAGVNLSAAEGASISGATVATFTDANPNAAASDFTATIDWGDGTAPAVGTVSAAAGGGFSVSGAHSYVDEGKFTVGVAITDDGGSTASATGTATVGDAALAAAGVSLSAAEGASISGSVATFTDANPNAVASDFTATINWGDGTAPTVGTVSAAAGGGFSVSGAHSYADEGKYTVGVMVTDDGGSTANAAGTATVSDAALTAAGVSLSAAEGASINGATVATFTDANPNAVASDFTATIDWGDGTAPTVGTVSAAAGGGFSVSGAHSYADEGKYTVGVAITDDGGSTASAAGTATVGDAALAAAGVSLSAAEGASISGSVATFTDANPNAVASDFTATINWGDGTAPTVGTVSANAGGGFSVSGAHSYADEGKYTVGVAITDDGGSTANATGTATVSDAALTAAGVSLSAAEGASISGATVATFTDANPNAVASDFTATINWGDGTAPTAGTVSAAAGGGFSVSGAHSYADEGKYTVGVAITDDGGSTANATGTATVSDADVLTPHGVTFNATPGQAFTGTVATFVDTDTLNTAGDFTATISWGDGTTSAGVISDTAGAISVSGTHTYATPGQDSVTVTLSDDAPGTATATANSTANVAQQVNAPPVITAPASTLVELNQASKIAGVSISDADAVSANETITVTLVDTNGLLSALTGVPGGGGTIKGAGTTRLTISGTLAQVNADLTTLTDLEKSQGQDDRDDDDEGDDDWSSSQDRFGSDKNDDEDGSPRGSTSDKITINASDSRGGTAIPQSIVIGVNAPPVIVAPSSVTVKQGQASAVEGVKVSDADAVSANEKITVSLSDTYGLLSATTHTVGGGGTISGNGTTNLTISGTLAQVDADLTTLTDKESSSKSDKIIVSASDGRGGAALPQTICVGHKTVLTQEDYAGGGRRSGPANYPVPIFGFDQGDQLDLSDFRCNQNTTVAYSGNSSYGVLTVRNGAEAANIILLGNYMASTFAASSDGAGGTCIAELPPNPSQNTLLTSPAHT